MRHYSNDEPVDALVIGTGAGGAPLMARLAGAGLSVVALEAGKQWNPARDFATDEKEQNKLFWLDERISAGGDPIHFGNNNSGIGVGGSTLHYTAYTPRAQPMISDCARSSVSGAIGLSRTSNSSRTTTSWRIFSACPVRLLIHGDRRGRRVTHSLHCR
jgi:choline dehydrogenase-like flavoprotein